jgi:PAS domain S-box-containing protein
MLLNARQIYRKDIGAKMILLAIEDITERRQLESLLIDSEEQYRRLFETASDGIVLLEKREGRITKANSATEKLLGYTEEDSIGNKLQDIGVVLDTSDFQTTMQVLNKSGIINYRNVKVETKSGQHIDTEIYLVDKAKVVQCNIRDVTERKRAKEALRESEEKYHWLVDHMADVLTIMDMNLRFTYVSPSILRLRGYTAEEAVAQTFEQMMTPESLQNVFKVLEEETALEASGTADPGRSRILELEEYRKDGSIVWSEDHLSFLRDETQKAVGIISLSRDITERKRAEEILRESKERYSALFDRSLDLIFITDFEGRFIDANAAALNRLGYQREEISSLNFAALVSEDQMPLALQVTQEIRDTGYQKNVIELRLKAKDGNDVFVETVGSVILHEGIPSAIQGIARDITDRKQAEDGLKETLENLRKAVGATIQVMVSAVEARDPYTAGHQTRSANLAHGIATEMGLPQEKIEGIRIAGSIHDIGNLSIPAEILSKPSKLTNIEFSLIKEHTMKGYEILKDVEFPWPLAEIVYQHHERMDGSGYPRNLKGDDIMIEARILSVADVVEAMASHRPYRASLGIHAALDEIEKNRGILYDMNVVDACLRLFREKGFQLQEARF